MGAENLLQSEVLVEFVYPFLLIFFIVFAILEKTKVFGDDKKQLNALIAFVIGLIFVGAVSPKLIVQDLILFLAVALVVVFIVVIMWGFATGNKLEVGNGGVKWVLAIVFIIAVVVVLFLITDVFGTVIDTLFKSDWSSDLWTNVVFIIVIAGALALAIGKKAKG